MKTALTIHLILPTLFVFSLLVIPSTAEESSSFQMSKRLKQTVETIVKEYSPRDYLHSDNLRKLAIYIEKQFSAAGGRASLQSFKVNNVEYFNVIGEFGPKSKERIVLGAHYDTAGPFQGADDNASGVAGIIEVAQKLKNLKLNKQIDLVAYSLEEPPFFASEKMGSSFHAKSLKEEKIIVRAMISLEMIGYFSKKPNSQEFPTEELKKAFSSVGDFIAIVGKSGQEHLINCVASAMRKSRELPVIQYAGDPDITGVQFSDHLSYWREGFSGLMITDTAFFRNKNYHQSSDTPDTLNYGEMEKVVQAVVNAIRVLNKGCPPETPRGKA